jgi:hypothetical protein
MKQYGKEPASAALPGNVLRGRSPGPLQLFLKKQLFDKLD